MTSKAVAPAAFALLCAIWGSTWLAIRIGLGGAPVFLAASLRFVIASLTLVAVAVVLRRRFPRGRPEWALALFVGLVLFTADYGLIYWGEGNGVESALSAILFATYPLQTAIAAHFVVAKERLSHQKVAGIALGFAGVFVIFREQLAADWGILFPMVAIVLAATSAALSAVALKRWGHDTDPVSFNAAAMAVGAVCLGAISLAVGEPWAVPSWPAGIGTIVYLALAGSVVTFVAWNWLLKRVEATTVSYVAFVTPIIAVLLGVGVGDERFDGLVLVGAAITLAGIWLSTSKRVGAWMKAAMGARSLSAAPADPGPPTDPDPPGERP